MKRVIKNIFTFCLCLSLLMSSAFAAAERIDLSHVYVELTAPEGFETLTPDNLAEHQKLLDYINSSQEDMADYMTTNFMEMFCMPLDKSCEMCLQVFKIDSLNIFDLAEADEDTLKSIEDNIRNDKNYTCDSIERIEQKGSKFFKVEKTDTAGIKSIAYTTVKNGANYALTLTKSSGGELTQTERDYIDFTFKSFSFTQTLKNPSKYNWLAYIMIGAIFVVAIAIIYVVAKRSKGWGNRTSALKMRRK